MGYVVVGRYAATATVQLKSRIHSFPLQGIKDKKNMTSPVTNIPAPSGVNEKLNEEQSKNIDDRGGLKFGVETAYDGDDASQYVASLPTEEEERRILSGVNIKAREEIENLDEGRESNHPSTLASTNKSGAKQVSECIMYLYHFSAPRFLF